MASGSLPEVVNRMVQLQYTSRIKLDEKLFDKIDRVLRLIERVDAELPADSPIRADEDYRRIMRHRRIDSFKVIEARLDQDLTNASDFSRASVEGRIQAGYDDAKRQGVAWPAVRASPPPQPPATPPPAHPRRPAPRPATRRRSPTRSRPEASS